MKALQKIFAALIFAIIFLSVQIGANAAADPVIQIETGKIRGGIENGVAYFKGIPYAAPPVGNLRWRPPQAPESWRGILDTKNYSNEAAQNGDLGVFAQAGGSEDCLYLNVFVDEKNLRGNKKLPVFFWIHGGALNVGFAGDYNPLELAKQGKAVVVTINYRLGIFGFFAHPAIDAENHAIGNYGLMDQIFALDWVKRNISNFGGDPNNITIAGESSGGQSVLALMTSPQSEGKFQSAIGMSACTVALNSQFTMYTVETAEAKGIALAEAAGLKNPTAEDLRNLTTEEILKVQTPHLLGTFVIEKDYLPEHIGKAIKAGHVHKVNFVNGTTRNEGSFFAGLREYFMGKPMDVEDYKKSLQELSLAFGKDLTEEIFAEYAPEKYSTPAEAYAAVITDAWFAVPAYNVNNALYRKMPVYAYEFDDRTAPIYLETSFKQGAAHTYEIPYIFKGFHGSSKLSTKLNPAQEKLSREMINYWANVSKLPKQKNWQPYNPAKENFMRFTLPKSAMFEKSFAKVHHVEFWNKILPAE